MLVNPIDTVVWDAPQLFVDSNIVECCQCVSRRWHKPVRHPEPVIVKDRPWEEGLYFTYSNYTVLHDPGDGKIKCWYEDLGPLDGKVHPFHNSLLYAESTDGLNFTKPELDVCEVAGRQTNIVMGFAKGGSKSAANPWAEGGVHSNAILINPYPATPEQRYLTVFSDCQVNGDQHSHLTSGAFSNDGIHWQPFTERPSYGSAKDTASAMFPASGTITRHACLSRTPGTENNTVLRHHRNICRGKLRNGSAHTSRTARI